MNEDRKLIEEIRNYCKLSGALFVPDMKFLLAHIDKLEVALRGMLKQFDSADLIWCQRKAIADASEALGEL